MLTYLTRDQSRRIDALATSELGIPSLILMENAARGCVDVLEELGIQGTVCIACGGGNNGGDGLAMARRLDLRGFSVKVFLGSDPSKLKGDALVNFQIIQRLKIPVIVKETMDATLASDFNDADWIVDALFGTGFQGPVRQPWKDVIQGLNEVSCKRLAVDIPSGLDCDTGLPAEPTIRADHTVTFVAEKVGFQNPAAQPYLGKVHVVDIGVSLESIEAIRTSGSSSCG